MEKYFLLLFLYFLNALASTSQCSVYDSLVQCFSENKIPADQISKILYSPQNPSFTNVLESYIRNRRFNVSTTRKPNTIITPTAECHVAPCEITSLRNSESGSKSAAADTITSLDDQTAWVQSGALLGELYYRIWLKSNLLGFPAGVCPTVGVGGHLSGGGYGNMIRKYGLSVDHVIDAVIVDANGRVLDRKSMGEDLFWAIRGGGGASFGVILVYRINLVPVPPNVTVFNVQKSVDQNAIDAVFKYQQIVDTIDSDLFIRVLLQPITVNNTRSVRATFIGLFLGDATVIINHGFSIPRIGFEKTRLFRKKLDRFRSLLVQFR
ncbi:hypothetical protein DH2020_032747 [Rehmannia glutinosa]|uniref:FAD-binding PCMH-type domain-containing protein n=1 Tax=Rehmannia glutinosa TaxID=99300 RepID=A0ABR0VGM6_REHGL